MNSGIAWTHPDVRPIEGRQLAGTLVRDVFTVRALGSEQDVRFHMANGLSNLEIADSPSLRFGTVRTHITRIAS